MSTSLRQDHIDEPYRSALLFVFGATGALSTCILSPAKKPWMISFADGDVDDSVSTGTSMTPSVDGAASADVEVSIGVVDELTSARSWSS